MNSELSHTQDSFYQRYGALLLLLFSLFLLFAGTPEIPLLDRDEPRFSQATREMIQRGEWAIPYFNDEYRFDKPVLTYWMMRIPYLLLGTSEWTARLHTVLSATALVLVTFFWGRKEYGVRAGFWAGFALLTCLQVMIHGRIAVADMPLILCITVTHRALWSILNRTEGAKVSDFFWLYGSMGVGFLAKGPLAVVVPLLTLCLFRFLFYRKPIAWRSLHLPWGVLLFLLIIAPWGLWALWKTGGLFWSQGMQYHVIDRGIEVFNNQHLGPTFYFLTVWISLFPWSLWLLAWLRDHLRKGDMGQAFLVSWFVGPFLIFTFYATQLPHYILPAFPAFFLLLFHSGRLPALGGWGSLTAYHILRGLFRVLILIVMLAAIWIRFQWKSAAGVSMVFTAIAFLLFLSLLLAESVYKRNYKLVWIACIGLVIGWWGLGYSMRKNSVVIPLAKEIRQIPSDQSAWAVRFNEPSLVFYGNRVWKMFSEEEEILWALRELSMQGELPKIVLLQRREMKLDQELGEGIQALFTGERNFQEVPIKEEDLLREQSLEGIRGDLREAGYEMKIYSGMNYARFTWVQLELWTAPEFRDSLNSETEAPVKESGLSEESHFK